MLISVTVNLNGGRKRTLFHKLSQYCPTLSESLQPNSVYAPIHVLCAALGVGTAAEGRLRTPVTILNKYVGIV